MGLGELASNFSNAVGSVIGTVVHGRTHSYPHIEGATNKIKPENWRRNLPYSFKVIGLGSELAGLGTPASGFFDFFGTPQGGGLFDEFQLPINPQELNQDENFAITITPTQKGVNSEHNGVVLRDLVINGTTGHRPNDYKSGYEYFHELRNYLRAYAQIKTDPKYNSAQLVFINRKDNETLIVEPLKFSLRRSNSGPFLYDYGMVFKVIGLRRPVIAQGLLGQFFGSVDAILETATDYILGARRVFETFGSTITGIQRDFISTILQPVEAIGLTIKTFRALPYTFADLPSTFTNDLSPATTIKFLNQAKTKQEEGDLEFIDINFPVDTKKEIENKGTSALDIIPYTAKEKMPIDELSNEERESFLSQVALNLELTRKELTDLKTNATLARDNFAEKLGLVPQGYRDFVGTTQIFNNDPRILSSEEVELLEAFNNLDKGINLLLSNNALYKNNIQDLVDDIQSNYLDNLNIVTPRSGDEIYLPRNTSLEDLAAQYLGTAERFIEIIIANNLVPPFIDENSTSPNVKKPGDKILIPRSSPVQTRDVPDAQPSAITENFTETEKNLGVDIKLNADFDFIFNNRNDFEIIAGGANAGQAAVLKLSYEKGDLKYHPLIGLGLSVGEKIRNGDDVRDDIVFTLLSDPKFEAVKDLSFLTEGNTIKIDIRLLVKNFYTPLPLTLTV